MALARLAALLVACTAAAQTPSGWKFGNPGRQYEAALDTSTVHGGRASARVGCIRAKCRPFSTLMQSIRADRLIGSRVRLGAWVKATKGASPRIWMRVDGEQGEILAFDNRDKVARKGPFDWSEQEVVLDVPPGASVIAFGLIVDGTATAWIDDISFDLVSKKVRSTDLLRASPVVRPDRADSAPRAYEAAHLAPENLDFEAAARP
jgi:hypothetical protein